MDAPPPAQPSLEVEKDACNYAIDLTKQFLTFAAAGIAFVVGLVFADKGGGKLPPGAVMWSIIALGASMLCGWIVCMAVTGKVAIRGRYGVYEPHIQLASIFQILFFGVGVLVLFFPTLHQASLPPTPTVPAR